MVSNDYFSAKIIAVTVKDVVIKNGKSAQLFIGILKLKLQKLQCQNAIMNAMRSIYMSNDGIFIHSLARNGAICQLPSLSECNKISIYVDWSNFSCLI